ncbi:MAG TPA: TonB-dependent receptor [Gemmatimonadaceae bacterium]|nr:TonB-dependent receptor [Gemmatimonadaceae bacterium]
MIRRRRALPQNTLALVALLALCLYSQTAAAQSSCARAVRDVTTNAWEGPLARRISLHGRDISLRDALDRLSASAHIKLSYTAEELVLSRAVCPAYDSALVGNILVDLLQETTLRPVSAGNDQVVLAPNTAAVPPTQSSSARMMRAVSVLNRVVVTGSANGGSLRSLPIALDVINGQQISQRGAGSLSTMLDGNVPGLWLFEQSPLSLLARYGSIRGASSFGVSYPKVYVDGIQVANSLLVTMIDPDAISRIEVIRGPQGAALYGADAISGVMNIVTRQDGPEGGGTHTQLTTSGGASASEFSAGSVFAQNHSLSLRSGSGVRSGRLGASVTTIGAFLPDAFSRQLASNGGLRIVGEKTVFSGTFRLFAQDARTPGSPLLRTTGLMADSVDHQSVRQFTVGGVATFHRNDRWTNAVVAGVDGYSLKSGIALDGAFPSATDSALRAAQGSAIRGTFRASTVATFGDPDRLASTVTLASEVSFMRDETKTDEHFAYYREGDRQGSGGQTSPSAPGPPQTQVLTSIVETRTNSGLIAQSNTSWHDQLFVNTGFRLERNTGLTDVSEFEILPMLGTAWVRSLPFATVKLRTAYGKGIRPPETSSRAGTLMGLNRRPNAAPLAAERQSGIEAGADLFIGRLTSLHLTRFDQRASGLIQPVSIAPPVPVGETTQPRRIVYELQNVGQITNRGWELEGNIALRHLSLGATFSTVDSRVQKLAPGYGGDLRVGDRMLEVPAHTIGINAAFTDRRWSTAWSVSRATDWVNYDRVALASAFQNQTHSLGEFWGSQLRTYWRNYSGVTRIGGTFNFTVSRGISLSLRGENLLDKQMGEPDNVTIVPGRTVTGGLKVSF